MKITNCINCGAILHSSKCEYCGTEYDKKENEDEDEIQVVSQIDNTIILKIYGVEKRFYINDMTIIPVCYDTYRDFTGQIVRTKEEESRIKINLISY